MGHLPSSQKSLVGWEAEEENPRKDPPKKLGKIRESENNLASKSREQYFIDKWEDDATEKDGKSFHWLSS